MFTIIYLLRSMFVNHTQKPWPMILSMQYTIKINDDEEIFHDSQLNFISSVYLFLLKAFFNISSGNYVHLLIRACMQCP